MKVNSLFSLLISLFLLGSCSLNQTSSETSENNSSSTSITSESSSSFSNSENNEKNLKKLTILSVNDLHGKIEQDENGKNGISNLSHLINEYRNQNTDDDVILLANGDMFQGQAISNLNYGESVINAMNEMRFDMMGIGNHEFDWGIEKVLRFFDNDKSNQEANFPLINSNIIKKDDSSLLEHTLPYLTLQKENIKVGIISVIGEDQKSSILAPLIKPYEFLDVKSSVASTAEKLRIEEDCDIVICNIHDGDTYKNYTKNDNNIDIASLKGNQRVDALINGHSHYRYAGYLGRNDMSMALPVVQAGSSSEALGVIELTLNEDKTIESVNSKYVYNDSYSFDQNVQDIVNNDYLLLKDKLEEVYCVSNEDIYETYLLRSWSASTMQKATDADIAFSNNGGLRNVNITKNQNITVSDLYEINPFDNQILLTQISGYQINSFINNYGSSNYYNIKDGVIIENSSSIYYTVAVIDYLGYKDYFPLGNNYVETNLIFRDVMGLDLKERHNNNLKFSPSNDNKSILNKLI